MYKFDIAFAGRLSYALDLFEVELMEKGVEIREEIVESETDSLITLMVLLSHLTSLKILINVGDQLKEEL